MRLTRENNDWQKQQSGGSLKGFSGSGILQQNRGEIRDWRTHLANGSYITVEGMSARWDANNNYRDYGIEEPDGPQKMAAGLIFFCLN